MSGAVTSPPPDRAERERIRTALDANILVEAGAGSGKTTSLVERLLGYVERGDPVESLAAVTFTRKAAAELRERFQVALEARVRDARTKAATGDADASALVARCERALAGVDGAFLGTIHSFCARLLRERPIAAGLDPSFEEVTEAAWKRLSSEFWRRWVEERFLADDPMIAEIAALGIHPTTLRDGFTTRIEHPDVDFSGPAVPKPDVAAVRQELERLLVEADKLWPDHEPAAGWDGLQLKCRRLRFQRSQPSWAEDLGFLDAITELGKSKIDVTQKRWADDTPGRKAAGRLGDAFQAFVDGEAAALLAAWREHRYPAVMRFLDAAAVAFERERLDTGQLGFEDLLLRARDLLLGDAGARRDLGRRYAHLLVDEFQDTDPIQAEVCFLLASDPESGSDWRTVTLRDGALFVVGDPKQSIYRFRRASIETYQTVKERFRKSGEVLELTTCFRCAPEIAAFVESHFQTSLPARDTHEQAAYAPMRPWGKAAATTGAVRHYTVRVSAKEAQSKQRILAADAEGLASWIVRRLAEGEAPEAFLILTSGKRDPMHVVRELGERNVPVSLTGGKLDEAYELAELLVVLRALADPENPVLVAAALEGWCFGLSPADLLEGRDAGLRFGLSEPPVSTDCLAGRALARMREWWHLAREWPLEEVMERLLDESGLLAHAAASELGESRAGALLKLVATLREATDSPSGLAGLVEALEESLASTEGSAQLRPERRGAVRVMNLHKAKGLEGEIVVLAGPVEGKDHGITYHVARSRAVGERSGLLICDGKTVIAQPPEWDAMEVAESRFEAAEEERLRYVATTRAKRELVVARLEKAYVDGRVLLGESRWAPLDLALTAKGVLLACPVDRPPGRMPLAQTAHEVVSRVKAIAGLRRQAGRATMTSTSVTRSAKVEHAERRADDADRAWPRPAAAFQGRGREWGSAVHRVMEGRGRGRVRENLRAYALAVALDEGLAATPAAAGPMADELVAVVERVWATGSGQSLEGAATRRLEWTMATADAEAGGVQRVTEGVIDAAAFDGRAWLVLDWKTDEVDDATWAERAAAYQAQVDRYAEILAKLRGEPATGTLHRTADGVPSAQ